MYKELVSSIESNLKRFAEVPELSSFITEIIGSTHYPYSIRRIFDDTLVVTVTITTSEYVFEGEWEAILARVTELWVNG